MHTINTHIQLQIDRGTDTSNDTTLKHTETHTETHSWILSRCEPHHSKTRREGLNTGIWKPQAKVPVNFEQPMKMLEWHSCASLCKDPEVFD